MFTKSPLSSFLAILIAFGNAQALVAPTEIYTGNSSAATSNDTALRIATGGAGQSGLVKGSYYRMFVGKSTDSLCSPCRRFHHREHSKRVAALHYRMGV